MGLEPFAARPEDHGESFISGRSMSDARKFPAWRRLPHYAQKAANYLRRILWLGRNGMLGPRSR
jgi:glycosyl transferase, family 25